MQDRTSQSLTAGIRYLPPDNGLQHLSGGLAQALAVRDLTPSPVRDALASGGSSSLAHTPRPVRGCIYAVGALPVRRQHSGAVTLRVAHSARLPDQMPLQWLVY
ncbi:Uncharacterised protein [Shigella sonnei]|nr:Uncharacterised protein [Shigella sonnei]